MRLAFTRRAISGLLATWLSGLALLLCCANMARAQAAELQADHCPLKKAASSSHCEKSTSVEATAEFDSLQDDRRNFNCCIFLPKIADKARGVEKNPHSSAAVAAAAKLEKPKFSFVIQIVRASPNYHSVVRNRGSTYLKNRVFRI